MRPIERSILGHIREALERKVGGFPRNCCQVASRVVRELTGLEQIAGCHVPSNTGHAWNYDPQYGIYVDLTFDQFDRLADPVLILPEDTPLLRPDDRVTLYQRRYAQDPRSPRDTFFLNTVERTICYFERQELKRLSLL